jgi:opine dehydrogenase
VTKKPVYAVLGASHSGFGLAADMSLRGIETRLFELPEFAGALDPVVREGGIHMHGVRGEGFAKVKATLDAGEAIRGVDAILCAVPAYGHRRMAQAIAPHLKDGSMVILLPGCTGGALEFAQVIRESGNHAAIVYAEAPNFIFACTKDGPASVDIHGSKRDILLAALPARATAQVLERLAPAYPEHIAARDVLDTGLNNINNPLHPAMLLLNSGRVEKFGGGWSYFAEGLTPAVGRLVEGMDEERMAVAAFFDLPRVSVLEWLTRNYRHQGFGGDSIWQALSTSTVHKDSAAPGSIDHRHFNEDIPYGLTPTASLGRAMGVAVPVMEGFITVASTVSGRDFWSEGRTVEKLGLAGKSKEQILEFVQEG